MGEEAAAAAAVARGAATATATAPSPPPHVLLFPLPCQGHVTPMLRLAEALCLRGLQVTFLTTEHTHRRLLASDGARSRLLGGCPGLHLRTIPDGLPTEHPRSAHQLYEVMVSFLTKSRPLFSELLLSIGREPDGPPPVACVIADAFVYFAGDVADAQGIPVFSFVACGAGGFWTFFHIPNLLAAGEVPFPEACNMDELLHRVPGMGSFLRRRDLPSFCRLRDANDPSLGSLGRQMQETARWRGLIINTVESLDATVLSGIRSHCPNTYTVGPVTALLEALDSHSSVAPSATTTSLFQEDGSCIAWLDARSPRSVVYVSFGSSTVLDRDKLLEFWYGLMNSGRHFLWVMRLDLVEGGVPDELAKGTEERGFLVEWAPQREVLSHPAVGAFLTHAGWNSTMESVCAGVPMVCWPFFGDQQVNSRYVGEVWKVGLDMKDTSDRGTVEKLVREVMEGETGIRMRAAAADMAKVVRQCVTEGGSSYENLGKLIQDIKSIAAP